MTTLNVLVMLAIPLALLGVLAIVLVSGRLRPQTRRKVELALLAVLYPALTVFFLWLTWQNWDPVSRESWLMAAVVAGFVVGVGLELLTAVRKLRQAGEISA